MSEHWIDVRAGERARQHLADRGLSPSDIGCIPAAAGGPKGLALLPLDRLLAREWLAQATTLELIGASIGAWRMSLTFHSLVGHRGLGSRWKDALQGDAKVQSEVGHHVVVRHAATRWRERLRRHGDERDGR